MAVVATEPLVLRSAPGTDSDSEILEARLYPGMRARVVDGPAHASGYAWYRLRVGQTEGWAAAGSREGDPWLATVSNGLIAFSEPPGSLGQVWTVDPEGGAPRQLTRLAATGSASGQPGMPVALLARAGDVAPFPPAPDASPVCGPATVTEAWSPDGAMLLFTYGSCYSYDARVVAITPEGDSWELTQGHWPAWSWDSQQVAIGPIIPWIQCGRTSCEGGTDAPTPQPMPAFEISVLAADGTGLRTVTSHQAWFQTRQPSWSPDGRAIAYVAVELQVGSPDIYVLDIASGVSTVLARNASQSSRQGPVWSPDGVHLAYATQLVSGASEVRILRLDTGKELIIGQGVEPVWSPDGSSLAYVRENEVHVAAADGTSDVVVASGGWVRWSPDGDQLLIQEYGDTPTVSVVQADGSDRRVIAQGSYPVWQPVLTSLAD